MDSQILEPVDIVISTYGRGASINTTIESIRANTHTQFTLWVLDQSEGNETEECVLQHAAEDARIHYQRAPLRGLCATRNLGSTFGNAPHILFTNDDMRLAPTWITAMQAALVQSNADAAFGRVQADHTTTTPNLTSKVVLGVKDLATTRLFERNWLDLGFGHGHNMGVTRASFERQFGFDECLGVGGPLGSWDERDYGYRLLTNGGRIVYTPDAIAYHYHWQDWAGVQRSYANYGIGTGAAVAKYIRCGRPQALAILVEWFLSQGLRQTLSGVVKWHSLARMRTGLAQLYYPIVGFRRGLRYPIERQTMRYVSK